MREFATKEDLSKRKQIAYSKDLDLPKNKNKHSKRVLKLVVLKVVVFPSLVVVLVSYCIYCYWSGIQSMAKFYFKVELSEFLEDRGIIFSKMRQICIKDKLQIFKM